MESIHDLANYFVEPLPNFFWCLLLRFDGTQDVYCIFSGDQRIIAASLVEDFGRHSKDIHDLFPQTDIYFVNILDENLEFCVVIRLLIVGVLYVSKHLGTNPLESLIFLLDLQGLVEGLKCSVKALYRGCVPFDVVIAEGQVLPYDDSVFICAIPIQNMRHRMLLSDRL